MDIETPLAKSVQVSDKFAIFYFICMGGATTISWDAIINCLDYFKVKYPAYDVSFMFPIAPYTAQLINTLVIIQLSNLMSYTTRIKVSLLTILAITAFVPFQADLFQGTYMGLVMILGLFFLLGFNNSMCFASVAGLASQIGGKYIGHFLIGGSLFSLFMNMMREINLLVFYPASDDDLKCVLAYFAVTCFMIAIGFFSHFRFMNSEFYSFHMRSENDSRTTFDTSGFSSSGPIGSPAARPKKNLALMCQVFNERKLYIILLFVACFQHCITYPGIMLMKYLPNTADHTKTLSMITTYGIFYIIGKRIGQYRQYYNIYIVLITVAVRMVLITFFLMQADVVFTPFIDTVWFGYANVSLFGITMGFLNVSLFTMAPENVQGCKKEVAGFLATFGTNLGCMVGVFSSLGLSRLYVQNSNNIHGFLKSAAPQPAIHYFLPCS